MAVADERVRIGDNIFPPQTQGRRPPSKRKGQVSKAVELALAQEDFC
jgi:hypothetical protein